MRVWERTEGDKLREEEKKELPIFRHTPIRDTTQYIFRPRPQIRKQGRRNNNVNRKYSNEVWNLENHIL